MGNDRELKLDGLKHLSTTHRAIHEARIGREFKLVVTTLTFFAAVTTANLSGRIPDISSRPQCVFSCTDCILLILYIFVDYYSWRYLQTSSTSNEINQSIAEKAEDEIESVINCHVIKKEKNKAVHPSEYRWKLEGWIIAACAIISYILITF